MLGSLAPALQHQALRRLALTPHPNLVQETTIRKLTMEQTSFSARESDWQRQISEAYEERNSLVHCGWRRCMRYKQRSHTCLLLGSRQQRILLEQTSVDLREERQRLAQYTQLTKLIHSISETTTVNSTGAMASSSAVGATTSMAGMSSSLASLRGNDQLMQQLQRQLRDSNTIAGGGTVGASGGEYVGQRSVHSHTASSTTRGVVSSMNRSSSSSSGAARAHSGGFGGGFDTSGVAAPRPSAGALASLLNAQRALETSRMSSTTSPGAGAAHASTAGHDAGLGDSYRSATSYTAQ